MELMADYICKKGNYFITGTDTGVGKTFVTVLLIKFLKKQGYKVGAFKPIESGIEENSCPDFQQLMNASNSKEKILYKLSKPLAPLIAANIDNVKIDIDKIINFAKNDAKNFDIYFVEGAGGLFVPITENFLIIDLIKKLNFEVILICRTNLGTVNHTLMSIETLNQRNIKIAQIILNEVISTPKEEIEQNIYMIEKFSKMKISGVIYRGQKEI